MAGYKFLLDNDVRHLSVCFPAKQTIQLEDVGLAPSSSDQQIIATASEQGHIIITNNRRDFDRDVPSHIAETSKKRLGCTQVRGLVIVLPSDSLKQQNALNRASKNLKFQNKAISWKAVNELCLKVVIEETGKATVTKLPRCRFCDFNDID